MSKEMPQSRRISFQCTKGRRDGEQTMTKQTSRIVKLTTYKQNRIATVEPLWYGQCPDNPLYTVIRYNDKNRYNDSLTVTKPSLKR